MPTSLTVAGLFAGIGGIELGLAAAGHSTTFACEIEPGARAVFESHFPTIPLAADIRDVEELPAVDLVAGGFPCQDLSQAGRTAGIGGRNSGLVDEVFRLVERMDSAPEWVLLENVPFMLQLGRGGAMRYVTSRLTDLGFRWAYRVIDARAFGLPQRRKRVLILASRTSDPTEVLFHGDCGEPPMPEADAYACGFYWTEGVRGLGWAVDAIPTLKGGSTIGIPSAPAVRLLGGEIVTPALEDAERLQGFESGWTEPAALAAGRRNGHRWKLLGNAVSVPVAQWVGERLSDPQPYDGSADAQFRGSGSWPHAAWCDGHDVRVADLSAWPVRAKYQHLTEFLHHEPKPLSAKAAQGFLNRTARSSLRFPEGLLADVEAHLDMVRGPALFV